MDDSKTVTRYAVAYLRVSDPSQIKNYSLRSQQEACQKEAKIRGYQLPPENIFSDEGESAKTTNRPGLIQLLAYCKDKQNKISACIAYKIDRLSRDTADYLAIRKTMAGYGVNFISCTEPVGDDPASQFIETILAAAGMYDNMVKRQRILTGNMARLKDGLCNKAPFGYLNTTVNDKKTITVDPEYSQIVKDAFWEFSKGHHTLKSITEFINNQLILKDTPRRFYKQQTSRLLANKTYCGYAVSKKHGEFKSDKIPLLVEEDIFYKVRSILLRKGNHPSYHKKLRPEFPLRGFLLCNTCNAPLTAGFTKGRHKYYGYYFCNTHGNTIAVGKADDAMINLLEKLTPDPLLKKLFIDAVKEKYNDHYMAFVKQEEQIKAKIKELEDQQIEIARKQGKGEIKDLIATKAIEQIDEEIMVIKTIKSEAKLSRIDIETLTKFMDSFLSDLSKFYRGEYQLELKRYLIGSIFPKKLYFKKGDLEPVEIAYYINLKQLQNTPGVLLGAPERTQIEPIIQFYYGLYQVLNIS